MPKTIVLGGGISALSYLFYNREARALAGNITSIGGMFATQAKFGPQYLWVDEYSERLLKDLRLPTKQRTVKVGVLSNCEVIYPHQVLHNSTMEDYALKTRGGEAKKSFMSGGNREYQVYCISMQQVVNTLMEAVSSSLVPVMAKRIADLSEPGSGEEGVVEDSTGTLHFYNKLVSTIPAPSLLKMMGREVLVSGLKAVDKYYCIANVSDSPAWVRKHFGKLDYVYCPELRVPYHRVTYLQNTAVFEYSGVPKAGLERLMFTETHRQPNGQIVGGESLLDSVGKHVLLLGRYAQWNHGVKVNSVLKQIMEDTK